MTDISSQPRLLSIPEVAERLGVNVRHIRRLVHERRIPFVKWGHLIRFKPTDIDQWINANTVELGQHGRVTPPRPATAPVRSPQRHRPTPAVTPRPSIDSEQLRLEP
jgi:excisionase family DNA binding protein